jgi:hypothetical protein
MPMKEYLYHGQAVAVHGRITRPVSHVIDGHGRCALADGTAKQAAGQHDPYAVPGILSYGRCITEVDARPEDPQGFFRTEVRATVEDLQVPGAHPLSASKISMGLVSVYGRRWYTGRKAHARRSRVLPLDCRIENLVVDGRPFEAPLPAPFQYSAERREAYLHGDQLDAAIDAEVRQAITDSPSRFVYVPDFGRIYFGEWTLLPGDAWHPIHRLTLLRLALGSPTAGDVSLADGQGDGRPTPP